MARRAVQGYSEKTYFENSRFLGMLATNDPLQEGYFKHLVNLNISDTGLSVKPRKGYLTTVARKDNEAKSLLSFSEDTVVIKAHSIQSHIVYDFKTNKAYAVDLSGYNVGTDMLITIDDESILIDYSSVIDYVLANIPVIKAYYDTEFAANGLTDARKSIETYLRRNFTILPNTLISHITNQYSVKQHLIKVVLEDTNTLDVDGIVVDRQVLMLAFYYRKNATDDYTANTLVFEVIDMNEHPTYDISNRNVASAASIIPSPLQRLYTVGNRPDGNISALGMMYMSNSDDTKYFVQYVPREFFSVRPHFVLNPASIPLNDVDALWAYRVDITSITEGTEICKGNWFTYTGGGLPVSLFPKPTGVVSSDLGDPDNKHYEGAHYVITLVPSDVSYTYSTSVTPVAPADYTLDEARYSAWRNILDGSITDKRELLVAIDAFKALALSRVPLIHVKDVRDNNSSFKMKSDWYLDTDYIQSPDSYNDTDYDKHFITLDEFREMIVNGSFDSLNLAWRLLPIGFLHYDTGTPANTKWKFYNINYWGAFGVDYDTTFINTYDKYSDLLTKSDFAENEDGDYIININPNSFLESNMPNFDVVILFSWTSQP